MCFTKNISLFTFLSGTLGGIICYSYGTPEFKIIGLFFVFVSLMQYLEYLLWSHQICDDYNKMISKIAMIVNHLQPIVLYLLVARYSKTNKMMNVLLVIYIIVISGYSKNYLTGDNCTMKDSHTHLNWEWNHQTNAEIVYLIFLICLVVFGSGIPTQFYSMVFIVIAVLSYTISSFIYSKTNSVGSMWCFFSAFAPFLFILLKKNFQKFFGNNFPEK